MKNSDENAIDAAGSQKYEVRLIPAGSITVDGTTSTEEAYAVFRIADGVQMTTAGDLDLAYRLEYAMNGRVGPDTPRYGR